MSEFDDAEHFRTFNIPEKNNLPFGLPKKGILQLPEIDPAVRMKWGLALLGEAKAKEYLAWLQAMLNKNSR